MAGNDNRHGARGAAWLAAWFPAAVTEPVRLHVPAKRYLCAVDPAYFGLLSEAHPYAADAIAVRRWDDRAKDPSASTPGFGHFRPVLEALLNARREGVVRAGMLTR